MKTNFFLTIVIYAIVSLMASSCGIDDNKIYPVKIGDNWGYVDNNGRYLVNPQFEEAYYFNCGLARVVKDGKVGYINHRGRYVINPEYASGTSFSEGRAFVVRKGEAPRCINTSGKEIFCCNDSIETVYSFNDGKALARTADSKTFIFGTDGKEKRIGEGAVLILNEGLAFELISTPDSLKANIIDTKGHILFSFDEHKISLEEYMFNEGLSAVSNSKGKYGYIDKKGNIVIDYQFDLAGSFTEGLAPVKVGKVFGYINHKGEFDINPQFDMAGYFSEGVARVQVGEKCGYIDRKGVYLVNPIYTSVSDFHGGYAFVVEDGNEKAGIIDKTGKMIVKPQFDDFHHWVSSKYELCNSAKYIGTAFINDFISRYSDGKWNGVGKETTLGAIRGMFKNAKAVNDNCFSVKTDIEPIDGLSLTEVRYYFAEKTYRMADKYVDYGFFTYKAGKTRQYNNSIKPAMICYDFKLSDSAPNKSYSIAKTLAEAIIEAIDSNIICEEQESTNPSKVEIKLMKDGELYGDIFTNSGNSILTVAVTL